MSEENTPHDLPSWTAQLIETKKVEAKAKDERIFIEEEIAKLVEGKVNGSVTVDAGEGFKVTVKRELGYTVNVEGLRGLEIKEEFLPLKTTEPVPAGYAFDKKRYEAVIEENPGIAAAFAEHITIKPKKTAVSIKVG